ncbi:MAG: hypothetical protein NTX64_16350, partial [Elusimicrobia bacterium]|nr:hypothetical protein [Elusimicrobiota bacterium]
MRVSILLTTVGQPNRPETVGKGGGWRGQAFLPSIVSRSAVSSPEMYALAPRMIWVSTASNPASFASAKAFWRIRYCARYSPRMKMKARSARMARAQIWMPSSSACGLRSPSARSLKHAG